MTWAHVKGYLRVRHDGRETLEHIAVAERAIGKRLPAGAQVHHFNGDRKNNSGGNLVICPNQQYHRLLHQRWNALQATGNPDFRKCVICKSWDHPDRMELHKRGQHGFYNHVECRRQYVRDRRAKSKSNQPPRENPA